MSEENLEVKTESSEGTDDQKVTTPELSPIEQRALEMGWRPKEDWDGDEADFISAEAFVARAPLFNKIEHQSRELKEVRKALVALQEHHTKVKEQAFKDAYAALKEEKKSALVEGDADRLIEIDEQIAELRAQEIKEKEVANTPQSQQLNPEFVRWVEVNPWYVDPKKTDLRMFADGVGLKYAQENPNVDPVKLLKHVEKEVKTRFKDQFSNERKERPSAVEGGTGGKSVMKSAPKYDLTEEERRVMHTFIRQGIMTEEEYITQLKYVKDGE